MMKKVTLSQTNTIMLGDNSLLRNETGWQALIPFEKTLDDLYDYWLEDLQKESSEITR